ncbi:MAG: DinB family protein [Holophagales bacterium]|nr:DinB family protein [Holophagales bacterium]
MTDCPFLSSCLSAFDEAERTFHAHFAELDPPIALRRPEPGRWSVAECIEHLNVTADLYLPRMEAAIRRGREKGLEGRAPFERRTLLGRFLLSALDPGASRRVPAPKRFRPQQAELDFSEVCTRFSTGLERFRDASGEADGLDLDRIRLPTPIAPVPRLTLAEAFTIHRHHIPRHLAQAKAALDAVGAAGPAP